MTDQLNCQIIENLLKIFELLKPVDRRTQLIEFFDQLEPESSLLPSLNSFTIITLETHQLQQYKECSCIIILDYLSTTASPQIYHHLLIGFGQLHVTTENLYFRNQNALS